ncbi:MAG: putative Ig domain-containing protein, partial [Anaerolineales bacterium]
NVSESNLPPEIVQPANQENVEGDSISLQISATDPNGDDLTYSAPNLPGDLSINQSGLISGVISFDASGGSPYTVGVTVEDDGTPNLSDSVSFTWTVNDYVPSPPDVTNPGPQSDYEGAALSLQIVASDPNGDPMTYAATGLPTGLSIAVDTGLISGKVGAGASGSSPYAVTVTVTDDNDNETPVEFVWTINPNAIPVITPISNQTTEQGDAVSLQVNATDGDADPLTYAALNLPPGLTINAISGLISGTVSMSAVVGVAYNVTVTVDDSKASPVTTVFNWTITSNRPPVVVQPANQVNVEGATVSLQVVASDPDEDTLTYSAIGLPPGLSINPTSGLISGVIAAGAGDFSPYTVKVKATDPKLLYDEKQFSWMVATDNSPPNVTNPGDQTNNKGDNVSLQIEATDPDGDSLEYSAFGLPSGLSINFSTGLISGVINSIASYFSPYNVTVSVDDGINDPVQAMFNWTIESPINNIYLPMVFGNPCSNFFDDFSDPNSGWAIGEDEDFSYGYFGGEYRVLSKNDLYGYLFGAPTCARENYTVEVDARWVGATGERYGILFGIIGDFDQFYQFDVNTDYQVYRIIFFNGIDYQYIVPQSYLPFINGGTSSNHLKITRIKNQISIDVNGNALGSWTDRNITGETYTGITSTPYIGYPISDARFDNFSVTQVNNLTQSSAIVRKSAGNFIPPRIYKLTPNREAYSTHSIQFMH